MPSNDPEYQKKYIRQHYLNNKEYYKQKARERNEKLFPKLKAFVNRYKLYCGCADCGYKEHPEALHFDHIRDKTIDVAAAVKRKWSLRRIKEEIRKCEVRCANCHAVVTAERRTE